MVVVGEDIAALLGLAVALLFVILALVTGNPLYDAAGSVVIGFLLIAIALMITLEIKSLIIGESADEDFKARLKNFVAQRYPQVELLNLITQHYGRDVVLAIKARFRRWPASAKAMVDNINKIEKTIRAEFPEVRFIFFEPDIAPDEKARKPAKRK
jgi:divalent metal cation (Fe/Co/Zn/Cd) transporter